MPKSDEPGAIWARPAGPTSTLPDMADLVAPTAPSRAPVSRSVCLLVAVLVFAVGIVGAVVIYSQAVGGEDRLASMGLGFPLVCASFGVGVAAYVALSAVTWIRVGLVGIFMVGLVVWTGWLVRPQAPTGLDHAERLSEGTQTLERDAVQVLDQTIAGRWRVAFRDDPSPCRDGLGRSQSAAQASIRVEVKPDLVLAEQDRFVEALRARGWQVQEFSNDFHGHAGRYVKADRAGYSISTDTAFNEPSEQHGDSSIYLTTPCLLS